MQKSTLRKNLSDAFLVAAIFQGVGIFAGISEGLRARNDAIESGISPHDSRFPSVFIRELRANYEELSLVNKLLVWPSTIGRELGAKTTFEIAQLAQATAPTSTQP